MVVTDQSGLAAFTDLSISGAVGDRTLQFSAPTLTSANSATIDLVAGPAAKLAFVTAPPAAAQSGVALATAPVVQLRDASDNDVAQAGVEIVASITTGGGTVSGASASTDADGRATFSTLAISGTVGARTIAFAVPANPALGNVSQGGIALAAGPASQITMTTQPATTAFLGAVFTRQPVAQLRDAAGNAATQAGVTVTASIASGAGTLAGTTSVPSDANGVATFTDLKIETATGAHALAFSAAGVPQMVSSSIQVTADPCEADPVTDTDGDRLPDCVESNTNVFVNAQNTGTNPANPDTDGDGLNDGDEVLGTVAGLSLPALGVNPLRKNLLIEFDWFDDGNECGFHTHRPTEGMIFRVMEAYANAPLDNPDGTTGITVIADYGQGGVFTGGNLIADVDGNLATGVNGTEFNNHKNANFDPVRDGYFYYAMMPHRYNVNSGSSGQAEFPGDDMIVSLYCANSEVNVANTIMHEWGHNLGLGHGGFENTNWKPNYNSVMNYKYQFPGVDNDCTPPGNGVLDYSRGTRPPLNEVSLDERQGVCGTPPGPAVDWNNNGNASEFGFSADINVDNGGVGDGNFTVLQDNDDWAAIHFFGLNEFDGMSIVRTIVSCTNAPPLPPPRR